MQERELLTEPLCWLQSAPGSSRMWKLHAGHGFEKRKQLIQAKTQRFIKRITPSTKVFIHNLRKLLDKLHLWKIIKED